MKRMIKSMTLVSLLCLLPISLASGQETKNEQKIKIVIADSSGTKTVLDTLINSDNLNDSVILKNKKIIISKRPGDKYISDSKDGKDQVYVVVSSDGRESNKEAHKVTKSFNVTYNSDDQEQSEEKTQYVIAKDGTTVTIESNDEQKAKEIMKDVEAKLGVKDDASNNKATVKVETKKKVNSK